MEVMCKHPSAVPIRLIFDLGFFGGRVFSASAVQVLPHMKCNSCRQSPASLVGF